MSAKDKKSEVFSNAWFARTALLAGIVKTGTGKACNECKTLVHLRQAGPDLIDVRP